MLNKQIQKHVRVGIWMLACLMGGSLFAQDMPNIVVVLADDIGPGDIGFYHRERTGKAEVIPTPNLDRLISGGMRFDDAHSPAPLCAPTRFGMMTGSYSYRNYKPYGVWGPWDKTGVDPQFTTSARIAKRAGYATVFLGKSGMGGGFKKSGITDVPWKERHKKYDLKARTVGPNQLGFDYSFELPSGIQNAPLAYYQDSAWYPIKPDSTFKLIGPKQSGYSTSRKHNEREVIGDSNWDPTSAGPTLAEKAGAYIERQSAASPEQPFFMYYCAQAVHIPHTPPKELDGVKIAGTTPGPHGDMVRELDAQMGVLIKSLKKAGVYDNTLFIFTSDNGGLKADPKAEELGHDSSNGWTGYKGTITEGGHRVPFIASWPGVIAPGTRSNELITALDVVATIAAVTGQKISRDQVMDSLNLMPLLTQAPGAKGHALLMHYSAKGDAALRQGDWKLHVFGEKLKNLKPKHLFNLKTNPKEDVEKDYLDDPAQQERVQRMLDMFKHCLKNPTALLVADSPPRNPAMALKLAQDGQDAADNAELTQVADMAVKMSGGDDSGPLPSRYQLANPLAFTEGGQWFKEAGLGLFIHWGPASVPDIEDVWRIRQPVKGEPLRPKVVPEDYYNRAPKGFTAKNYDPKKWMRAASKAGFRYAVLTSKHHDGYSLWPSKHSDLGVQTYLNGRDLLQPYVDAVRENGMKVGFYFSAVDWWKDRDYMNYKWGNDPVGWDFKGKPLDSDSVKTLPMEIVEQKKMMVFEVMERYRPDLWWWDTGLPVTLEETALKYNPDMIFNNRGNWYHAGKKQGNYPGAHYVTPEGFHALEWKHVKQLIRQGTHWEVCMTFNRSGWFYYSPRGEEVGILADVMYALARVRSWEGNLLLNMAPRADGTMPKAIYESLDKMARWMEWGAVSMFDTKGTHFPEHSNVPITTSKDGRTWWLHARPGAQADAHKWGKWKRAYYTGTEPGKPIRVTKVPKVLSVKLLRTGKPVIYTYENGTLVIANPDAGPGGLHEVLEVKLIQHL